MPQKERTIRKMQDTADDYREAASILNTLCDRGMDTQNAVLLPDDSRGIPVSILERAGTIRVVYWKNQILVVLN